MLMLIDQQKMTVFNMKSKEHGPTYKGRTRNIWMVTWTTMIDEWMNGGRILIEEMRAQTPFQLMIISTMTT
jgi:hypothetical protein